ncbi:DUF4258 domain-containing protein [Thiocapsa bogorovii]|uniref:DUF4258 domain-containing protein n=1 Tax=Thiocapsa bogorovii TaxID=521689 RepID=UPI001E61B595|nr:DUF4258 domain-containing protein [Thiocapsa bogorovii]UHD15736.1 DUF4258 domain-containing protein [Thiocapsa bogorovii]
MSDSFESQRFGKTVWLTNHAIESMAKRQVTLNEVQVLIEQGTLAQKSAGHSWISHRFPTRNDNLVCAAIVEAQAVIIKTVMVNWRERGSQ